MTDDDAGADRPTERLPEWGADQPTERVPEWGADQPTERLPGQLYPPDAGQDLDDRIRAGLAAFAARRVPDGSLPTSLALPAPVEEKTHSLAKWLAPAIAAAAVVAIAIAVTVIGASSGRKPSPAAAVPAATVSPTPTATILITPSPTRRPTLTPTPTPAPTPVPTPSPVPTAVPTAAPTKVPAAPPAPPAQGGGALPLLGVGLQESGSTVTIHVGQKLGVNLGGGRWDIKELGGSLAGSDHSGTAIYTGVSPGLAAVTATRSGGGGGNNDFHIVVVVLP